MASFREFAPQFLEFAYDEFAESARQFPFPLLTFSSYLTTQQEMSIPLLRPFHRMLAEVEQNSDGLVPTASGKIPGVSFISFAGLDHTDPVVSWGKRGQRPQFIGAILKVFLLQLEAIH
jgi:hypothetical protein